MITLPRSEWSPAFQLAQLPQEEQRKVISSLTPEQIRFMPYEWKFWARPKQYKTISEFLSNDKSYCLITSGRGFGKTRTGAEWVRYVMENGIYHEGSIVAPTAAIARDIMVKGKSGILASCPPNTVHYEPSKLLLTWPATGGVVHILSADDPDRLRGFNNEFLWAEELAAWDKAEDSWDQLMFTLRIGESVKALITSTPQPLKLLADLMDDPGTMLIEGSTYENASNLNKRFLQKIIQKYEGTNLGEQEIYGKLLKNMGGLFKAEFISRVKYNKVPEFIRTVVAIDPAASSKMTSNDTAIAVASKGTDGKYYLQTITADKWTPKAWADKLSELYKQYKADCIIAEINNGGEMVEHTIQQGYRDLPVKVISASKGKTKRAEPISLLYQQGKIFHVDYSEKDGTFKSHFNRLQNEAIKDAEKQMFVFRNLPNEDNDKVDAIVYAFAELSGNDNRDYEVPAVAGLRTVQQPQIGSF